MDVKKTECFPSAGCSGEKISNSMQKNDHGTTNDTKDGSKITEKDHTGYHARNNLEGGATEYRIPREHGESGPPNAESSVNPVDTIRVTRGAVRTTLKAVSYHRKFVSHSDAASDISLTCMAFAGENRSRALTLPIMNHYTCMGYQWRDIARDIREAAQQAHMAANKAVECARHADNCSQELVFALKRKSDNVEEAQRRSTEAAIGAKTAADDVYKKEYKLLVAMKACWENVPYIAICYPALPGKICYCSSRRWKCVLLICLIFALGIVLIILPNFVECVFAAYVLLMNVGIATLASSFAVGLYTIFEPRISRCLFMNRKERRLAMCEKHLKDLAQYAPYSQETEPNPGLDEYPQDCSDIKPLL